MLSYKMDFSSCNIMLDFGKSSHIYGTGKFKLKAHEYITCMYFVTHVENLACL